MHSMSEQKSRLLLCQCDALLAPGGGVLAWWYSARYSFGGCSLWHNLQSSHGAGGGNYPTEVMQKWALNSESSSGFTFLKITLLLFLFMWVILSSALIDYGGTMACPKDSWPKKWDVELRHHLTQSPCWSRKTFQNVLGYNFHRLQLTSLTLRIITAKVCNTTRLPYWERLV